MTEIVRLTDVTVTRGGRSPVLQIGSLAVGRGELVALVGPNGAGKSTLLQTVNLLHPYQGEIRLFGEKADKVREIALRRRSALVFQDALPLEGSVYDNVAWPLRFRGEAGDRIREKVDAALASFGCAHLAGRRAKQLSGGEQQRVCIARALVAGPELVLLDEPFASLDIAVRTAMMEDIRAFARQNGITVLMVSHNFADVLYFAERAVAIFAGRIVQDGAPQEMLRRPADERVARLVGMDNILPCRTVEEAGRRFALLAGGARVPLNGSAVSPSFCCLPGDELSLCGAATPPAAGDRVVLAGVVERVIPAIGLWCVLFRMEDTLITARLPRHERLEDYRPGSPILFSFRPDEAQFV